MLQLVQCLSYVALALTLLGTVLLAFALDRFVSTTVWAIDALATSIETIAHDGDRYVFTGIDTHMNRDQKRASRMTRVGIALILLGVATQAVAIYIQAHVG